MNRAIIGSATAITVVVFLAATPARAQKVRMDLPARTVGQQVMALGRVARISVVVDDARLWSRPVRPLRGEWPVATALAMIASQADARVERVGSAGWRLVSRPSPAPRPRPRVPTLPVPQTATEPDSGADIVVTASKRDISLANFAGQYTRIAGRDLDLGGAGGTDRLVSRTASVSSTYLGAGRNKLFIRGIADSSFTGPTQTTVGQYFGDLRLSYNAPDPDLRLSDMASVEVLEGPQGTLYGAGALGGLIRLVPNAPDPTRTTATVTLGGATTAHGSVGGDAHAVLNVPVVSDRLAVRIVADGESEGGYIDKPLLNRADVNRTRILGGRATARLDLGAGWTIDITGIGQRIRGADSQYTDRDGPPLTRYAPVTEGFEANFGQAQLVLSGHLGDVRFRSTSGVTAHDLMERYDATPEGGPARLFAQANHTRMRANETRAWRSSPDGSGWLAGFSYLHSRTRLTRLYGPPGALEPTTGVANGIEEATLYGEASRRLLPGLLVTGGLRMTRSVLTGEAEDVAAPISIAQAAVAASRAQTVLLPSASALVDLSAKAQLFARYQQGFRPGGLAIESDYVRRFRDDRVATVEAGVRWGHPRIDPVDLAVTVARTAWQDIQADFLDRTGLPSTANIGDGRLWTIEGTMGIRVASGLRLEGSASYNDSRIDAPSQALVLALSDPGTSDPVTARADVLARMQIPNIARITTQAGGVFERQLSSAADLRIDGWLRYIGSSRLGVGPVLGQSQGSYFDSGVTARLGLHGIGVTAGITNIADVRGNRFALGTPFITGRDQITPLRPRTLRLGVDMAY